MLGGHSQWSGPHRGVLSVRPHPAQCPWVPGTRALQRGTRSLHPSPPARLNPPAQHPVSPGRDTLGDPSSLGFHSRGMWLAGLSGSWGGSPPNRGAQRAPPDRLLPWRRLRLPAVVLQPNFLPPPGLAGGAQPDARFVPWPRHGGRVRGHPGSPPHPTSPLGPSSRRGSGELAGSVSPACSPWTWCGLRHGQTRHTAPASAAPHSIPGWPGGCSPSSAAPDDNATSLASRSR